MAGWYRVLDILKLPERPAVLVVAPQGDAPVVEALLELRPSAQVTSLRMACSPEHGREQHIVPSMPTLGVLLAALKESTVDAALFDHALDDMVIEALSGHEGLGAQEAGAGEYSPWARSLRAYWRVGDLEEIAAPFFVDLLKSCQRVLRRSAKIVLHHRVLGADLEAGQPIDLYTEYIELARRWIRGSPLPLREVALDTLDPQWWLCLEREG